ncbi:MAG: methyltransferase family protein, partial [Planctomycetota bacterium]
MNETIKEFTETVKSFAMSRILMATIELDLFPFVEESNGAFTADELVTQLDLDKHLAMPFLSALVTGMYLTVRNDRIGIGPKAKAVLESYSNLKDWNHEMAVAFRAMGNLGEYLKTGVKDNALLDLWGYKRTEERDMGGEGTERYSGIMDRTLQEHASAIAEAYDF